MNSDPTPAASEEIGGRGPDREKGVDATGTAAAGQPNRAIQVPRGAFFFLMLTTLCALVLAVLLWQRLGAIQEQLARQSADSSALAMEARSLSKQASDLARETAAKVALSDAKVAEAALQRSQLEALLQSLSRTRDENLVVDIESEVRLAQQQAQLTGSVEPLIAALKSADQRVLRAAQPRLANLQRAIGRDLTRIQSTALSDTPALLVKLDELARATDDLPLANAVGDLSRRSEAGSKKPLDAAPGSGSRPAWWQNAWDAVKDEARGLLRVSRIEQPEAALLSPEQAFFVRENLKLKILNARLGLLARQLESVRSDLNAAASALAKYFDASSRKTQHAVALLAQVQSQARALELPRVDETLAALSTAAAGR